MLDRLAIVFVAAATLGAATIAGDMSWAAAPGLDYEFYRNQVEPIFLKKREGVARCYQCHVEANNLFRLERLAPGQTTWTEEQSRRNFELTSLLVTPTDWANSRLLIHPLAPEAGGDLFHSGGRQFKSKDDPDWRVLAEWAAAL